MNLTFVLVWMLMTVSNRGQVTYSPATDLESCQRMQSAAIEALRETGNPSFYLYAKCIQIRVMPEKVK